MKKIILLLFICMALQLHSQCYLQQANMWCWAASIQNVMSQANVHQTQPQIAARLTGWPQNRPATQNEVVGLLNSYGFRAWTVPYPANQQQLYDTLYNGWKIIAFVNPTGNPQVGHFIVLQGIYPNGNVQICDPANGASYQQNIADLYYSWRWSNSVVVGTPAS